MILTGKKAVVLGFLGSLIVIGVVVAAVLAATRTDRSAEGHDPQPAVSNAADSADNPIPVKVVHPKQNHEFVRSVTQPVYIKGYYRADLMAHAAGPVKFIQKNIGDPVKQGEVLVELDVPDLVQDLAQKETLVKQAEQDVRAAEANVAIMTAGELKARSAIKEKEADTARAAATRKYRQAEYQRFKNLAANSAVVGSVVDERLRDYEAAEADWQSTQVAIETARASWQEIAAKLNAAKVDVDVKQSRVAVAKADVARAQAMLDYAKVRAPFTGTIVARHVDPGSFVQNAGTGHSTPVLSVVRTDIVTAVMWVPEKDVPYVSTDTEAVLRLDALGNREIRAKVTRLSHWLDPDKSRDMRVEVDLDNSPEHVVACGAGLGPALRPSAAGLLTAANSSGVCGKSGPLRPGMYGTMTLVLQKFADAYLVPSGAVFERGGRTYICEVKDDRAHLVPVRVQLEDGVQAKICTLSREVNPRTGNEEEVAHDLTGSEQIIRSGQGEIAEGQLVRITVADW